MKEDKYVSAALVVAIVFARAIALAIVFRTRKAVQQHAADPRGARFREPAH